MADSKPVKMVIVGSGMIAEIGYQPCCLAYPHRITLHGYFDQVRPRAQALRDKANQGKVYASLDEIFADPEVEAIINLTSVTAHYPVSLAALRAGKHVFSEKAVTCSIQEADELIREAQQRNLTFACAPSTHLGCEQQEVGKLIRSGKIGQPHTVIGAFPGWRLEAWHPDADNFAVAGPGVAADTGPYPLTAMTTYFGPIRSVFAYSRTVVPNRVLQAGPRKGTAFTMNVPDQVMALMEFDSGVRGFLYTGWTGRSEIPRLEIHGTDAVVSISADNDGTGIRSWSTLVPDIVTLPSPEKTFKGTVDWGKGVADFAQAIRDRRPPRCSAAQARHVLELAEKFTESARTGLPVSLTTRFDPPAPITDPAPWE